MGARLITVSTAGNAGHMTGMETTEPAAADNGTTSDAQAVLERILRIAAEPGPGISRQHQLGWEKAMEAVAAIAGTYRPEHAYQADLGFGGMHDIGIESVEAIRNNRHVVYRRAVGPWEVFTGTPE